MSIAFLAADDERMASRDHQIRDRLSVRASIRSNRRMLHEAGHATSGSRMEAVARSLRICQAEPTV